MEKKEKILLVHNYYRIPGGEDSVVQNEKKLLEENGHEVVLYSRNNNEIDRFSFIKKVFLPFISIFNFRTYFGIKKIIKKEKIDIVHVHNTLTLISPAVYYAAKKMKVPVVQTIHNFRMLCPKATFYRDNHICEDCVKFGLKCSVKNKCYRDSKIQSIISASILRFHRLTGIYKKINYICLTEFNKGKLLLQKQVKEDKIFIKPNYFFSYTKIIPYKEREYDLIFAGRLDSIKGIDYLLKEFKEKNIKKSLLICGTGPLSDWCKTYIEKNKFDNVKMLGYVENNEVVKLIANSKALILPTMWYEGFPMTLVEAFSVGTPVIGTNIGNVGNLISNNQNGWKFNTDVDKVINNMSNITEHVLECSKKFSKEENYKMLKKIYSEID